MERASGPTPKGVERWSLPDFYKINISLLRSEAEVRERGSALVPIG